MDTTPKALAANSGKAFVGSYVLGTGFTFDDVAAAKGQADDLGKMRSLILKDARNGERIFPYIGGKEVNTSPSHAHHRFVIDFYDRPLLRDSTLKPWAKMDEADIARCRVSGIVPADYSGEVAEDWPDLISIIRTRVKPERDKQKRDALRVRWWQYAEKRPGLRASIASLDRVLVRSLTSTQFQAFTFLEAGIVYDQTLLVWASTSYAMQALLISRLHETWARFLGATFKDDGRYNLADCFRNFPLPMDLETITSLELCGEIYHLERAKFMRIRDEGLTKIYNRFHSRSENALDIVRLRELHAEIDASVLRAYGWDDLADGAEPEFVEQDSDEGKTPKTRLDWTNEFKDEVLARLLLLNAERAAAERAAGLLPAAEEDETEDAEVDG